MFSTAKYCSDQNYALINPEGTRNTCYNLKSTSSSDINVKFFPKLRNYNISPTVCFIITSDKNGIYIDCNALDLHSAGKTEKDALDDLISEIDFIWDHYVNGDIHKLSPDAQKYAKSITDYISKA